MFRAFRRSRYLRRPVPEGWTAILERRVPFFRALPEQLRPGFLDKLKVFIWEKEWVPANGMEITEEVQVVIAATAVRLIVHLDLSYYDRLREIIVYPSAFKIPDHTGAVLGEARHWGSVILSWESVVAGISNPADGHATAAHEFAHVLDRADGAFDGTPELRRMSHYRAWTDVMNHHFERLQDGKKLERKVLRDYGALNEAEFFAVATEAFFEKPRQMRQHTPELYDVLCRFYGWNPADEAPPERMGPRPS